MIPNEMDSATANTHLKQIAVDARKLLAGVQHDGAMLDKIIAEMWKSFCESGGSMDAVNKVKESYTKKVDTIKKAAVEVEKLSESAR